MSLIPETRYAKSGDLNIAYQVIGDGSLDLVLVPGYVTHVEMGWEARPYARFLRRLGSFSRLIIFDKRGSGLSDPASGAPTLEERMDDVRAVMDAAGCERAALFGVSEGGPMSILFAATYPDRISALVLHGAMARSTEAPDYPWAAPAEAIRQSVREFLVPSWGRPDGVVLEIFNPSIANDPEAREFLARFEHNAASPAMAAWIFEMSLDIDVRHVLPSVQAPTLVLHRRGDRVVNRRAGVWLAGQIPGARFHEVQGQDHLPWTGDQDAVLDEIQEFLTGVRASPEPDRVLATVMFIDIVDSTKRAAEVGDRRWREILEAHQGSVRRELVRFRGREVKTLGDGSLATFDGPARAIRCGLSIVEASRARGLEARIGLHSGEVELMGDDVGGIAVHLAARVGDTAGPNEVLVSSTVKDLVAGSGLAFDDRGEHALKGVPGEWRLYAVRN
jgi:pimeloyl-ACP methyl ester carboxylesterase